MKNSIKREQSRAGSSFAERENFRPKVKQLKKTILTLVALLALTTQAWATEVTVTKTVLDLFPNVSNGTLKSTLYSDANLGIFVNDGLNGKVYGNGTEWHLNQDLSAVFYVNAPNATIKTVAFEFTVVNGGILKYGGNAMTSGLAVNVNAAFAQFEVGNSGDATNGVVKISGFTVVYETASGTPVPITWDADAKTATIDAMPAGNVLVTVNYFDEAAFAVDNNAPTPVALAPTANNTAKANTDDPLVEGGTVANIVEGTEELEALQGTLLYYFDKDNPTTQLTADDLKALTADDWSETAPTADGLHFDAATDVYVYYYIKGADDVPGKADGVKHTFSDTEIVELSVTLLPEPEYIIELNDATAEAANWKAKVGGEPGDNDVFPLTGVKKGDKVTVKYSGERKVIGVKAVKNPLISATSSDVHKLICAEGHIHAPGAVDGCTATRVAKIFYVGKYTYDDTYKHGLALAVTDEGQMDWSSALTACANKNTTTPVKNAKWVLASNNQWIRMIIGAGASDNIAVLTYAYNDVPNGTNLHQSSYWMSTENNSDDSQAQYYKFQSNNNSGYYSKTKNDVYVRACLVF